MAQFRVTVVSTNAVLSSTLKDSIAAHLRALPA
jgi:hypothetical protein